MTGHIAAAAPSVLKMSTKYEIIISFLKYRAICEKNRNKIQNNDYNEPIHKSP